MNMYGILNLNAYIYDPISVHIIEESDVSEMAIKLTFYFIAVKQGIEYKWLAINAIGGAQGELSKFHL